MHTRELFIHLLTMAQLHSAIGCVSRMLECYSLTYTNIHQLRERWMTEVAAIWLKKIFKHFSKADTVRKQEIEGRKARKLNQLLLLSGEFPLPQC